MALIDETVDNYRNQTGEDVRPVTIRADARATHQSVVTAMDVLGRLGFRAISIATVNESGGAPGAN